MLEGENIRQKLDMIYYKEYSVGASQSYSWTDVVSSLPLKFIIKEITLVIESEQTPGQVVFFKLDIREEASKMLYDAVDLTTVLSSLQSANAAHMAIVDSDSPVIMGMAPLNIADSYIAVTQHTNQFWDGTGTNMHLHFYGSTHGGNVLTTAQQVDHLLIMSVEVL